MKKICELTIIGKQNADKLCQILLESGYMVKSDVTDLGSGKYRWVVSVFESGG